ncbi:MAG: ABC transporter permease subunit [Streptosporangiaceae bacterium]|jgi:ABC-type transport system involved in multi-copper enzyme maturation permease subunit
MTATITPYRPPQQDGRDGFAQLLHAEWTKFRTLRGWVIAIVVAAAAIAVVGVLLPHSSQSHCGSRSGAACLALVATGPGGEAVNDSYYLAAQPLAVDGSITVRLTSLTGLVTPDPNLPTTGPQDTMRPGLVPWAKAGIIITASTRPGAAYVAMMVTGSHGVRLQYDYTSDIAGLPGSVSAASPRWLRLARSGDVVTGYDSADGRGWTEVGVAHLAGLTGTVRAGMFATSPLVFFPNFPTYAEPGGSLSASLATGAFDDVHLSGGAPGGRWAGQNVGTIGANYDGPRIGLRQAGGKFTVTGSGDIGPVVAAGTNSIFITGTLADHLFGVFIGLLIMIVIAAMFITVEYRRGLIAATLAASPRRGRLLAAKAVVIGMATFVLGSAAAAVAVIVGTRIAHNSGIYVLGSGWPIEVRVILGTGAMLAVASVLALSIATMLRRSVAAVAAVVVVIVLPYIIGVTGILPATASEWILRVTPAAGFAVEQSVPQYQQVVGHYGPPDYYPLAPWSGFAVLCLYAAVALGLAAWLLRRRDA